jgi:hypothetical protein
VGCYPGFYVVTFLRLPALEDPRPELVIAATGVGGPVVEMVRERVVKAGLRARVIVVSITAGSAVSQVAPGAFHMAKKQLVSVLQVLLGERRLHVAPALEEAATLVKELGTFPVKITSAANEQFESGREKDHDDMVLAVALAAWWAVRPRQTFWIR